jgi:chromosome partitioning protein
MSLVFAITNQKGGVGKTTTTVSLAAALAHRQHRVLIVDIDPQANATSAAGVSESAEPGAADAGARGVYAASPLPPSLRGSR